MYQCIQQSLQVSRIPSCSLWAGTSHNSLSLSPKLLGLTTSSSIKIKVDATISTSKVAFAVVARDHLGAVVKVWPRILPARSSLQAKPRLRPPLGGAACQA
ncbi:hypothetical protein ACB092_10G041800 [Castanea dentata]